MNSVLVDHEFMNNIFKFNPELLSNFSKNQSFEETFQNLDSLNLDHLDFDQNDNDNNSSPELHDFADYDYSSSFQLNETNNNISSSSETSQEIISPEIPDFPDDCLKFISDVLLEEGSDQNPASAQEYKALEATEKSLYDALGEAYPYPYPYPYSNPSALDQNVASSPDDGSSSKSSGITSVGKSESSPPREKVKKQTKSSKRKKNHRRDDEGSDANKGRNSKLQATTNEDYVEMEQYDDVILCSEYETKKVNTFTTGGSVKTTRGKKQNNPQSEEVDLRVLLTQCAQAVSTFDLRTSNELLKKIRQHASPYGDSVQRLAHHVASGLEARLAGTGSTMSSNIVDIRISAHDVLKAYKTYVSSVPFKRMSYFVANTTILKLAEKATKIHIIDFGIFLGLQWPCFIKHLSKRANGPPKLKITGIDFPQHGFRPAERIDATGRRLSGYCERFCVPFEYNGIAEKWENIQLEDLQIEKDELVIVNCMYRSGTLLDETVDVNSPRDAFLRLIRTVNPDLFVHGVINGTFNAPFFITRFREALYHYSSMFEVFDATMPRESHERLLIESETYGKEVYNLVACEGVERVHRPESYKQWKVRQTRAGFRQEVLDREVVSRAKAMVNANYHGDFLVDEDRHWMLQGWKGRIFSALSFWRPN